MLKYLIFFVIVILISCKQDKNTKNILTVKSIIDEEGIGVCDIKYKFNLMALNNSMFLGFGGGLFSDKEDTIEIQQNISNLRIFHGANNRVFDSWRLIKDTIIEGIRKRGIVLYNLKKEHPYSFTFQYKYFIGSSSIFYTLNNYSVYVLYSENNGGFIPQELDQSAQKPFSIAIHTPASIELLTDFDSTEKKNSITTYHLNKNINPNNLAFVLAKKNTFFVIKNQGFQYFRLKDRPSPAYFDTISNNLQAVQSFLNNYLNMTIDQSHFKIFEIPNLNAFTINENHFMFVDSTFHIETISHEYTHKWTSTHKALLSDSLYYFFAESINEFLNFKFYCYYNKKDPLERIKEYRDYYLKITKEKGLTEDFPIRDTPSAKNYPVSYFKAPCILYKIEKDVGEKKMMYFIRKILRQKEMSQSIFLDMLEKDLGPETKDLFLGYIYNKIALTF